MYCVGSVVTANDVLSRPHHFGKPVKSLGYRFIALFGNQIVSAQTGTEHRRHRGVVKGCFGEEIMKTVWANSVKIMDMMMESEGVVEGGIIPDLCDAMMRATLALAVDAQELTNDRSPSWSSVRLGLECGSLTPSSLQAARRTVSLGQR